MRKYTSTIWKVPAEMLKDWVKTSKYFKEILAKFGLENKGNNYKTLQARLKKEGISFEHILLSKNLPRGGAILKADSEVFVENSSYARKGIKNRILKKNLLPEICSICGQLPSHNDKKLVLVLDHINGVPNDNRIENLRFVCPNCNSQLETFAGKHNKGALPLSEIYRRVGKNKIKPCSICGEPRSNAAKHELCLPCYQMHVKDKKRPQIPELIQSFQNCNFVFLKMGKQYGVSDNAVRKWVMYYHFDPKELREDPYFNLDWSEI
ncbi:MAG: hypothetical protein WC511_01955 [Candidatus Pacearchaeota archaeon]